MKCGSFEIDLGDFLGWRYLPIVMQVYIVLLIFCLTVLFWSAAHSTGAADEPMTKLFNLGVDSFKIVFGAVIGALSTAVKRTARK